MYKSIKNLKYFIPIIFLFLLLKPLINCQLNTLPIKSEKNNPMNSVNITALIENKTDIFFVSTKDGYLHALSKEKKELWKTYLERELISSPASILQIGDDLYLYPYNEELYIYKNGQFFSFQLFIKDLVKKQYANIKDFLLVGKTKTTLYIIDIETGEILTKSDNNNNLIHKKRYITQISKKKTITVLRIDYILTCLGIGDEQKYWDASYSDVVIQRGNEDSSYLKLKSPQNTIKKLIVDYFNNLHLDEIVTVHSFFYNNDLRPVKIFDRSESNKYFDANNKKEIDGEIRYLTKYNDENEGDNIDVDKRLQALQEINNYREWRFPEFEETIEEEEIKEPKNNNNNNNYVKIIIFLIIIICLLSFRLIYERAINYFYRKKNKELIEQVCKEIKNCNINNYNIDEIDKEIFKEVCCSFVKDKLSQRKMTEIENNIPQRINNKIRNLTEKFTNKIENIQLKNNNNNINNSNVESKLSLSIDENYSVKNVDTIKSEKNIVNESSSEEENSKNYNHKSTGDKTDSHHEGLGIWDDDETSKSNSIKKSIENSKKNNGIWDDDETLKSNSIKKNQESSKKNNGIWDDDETLKTNSLKKNQESSKKTKGIWDDDEDEDEKTENINNNNNESKNINKTNKKNENSSTDKTTTNNKKNNYSFISKKIKENNMSRLDQDFESLEKIGQGGFGIVLKGRHLLDKGIWAIKVIKLSSLENKDDIVNEAITMMNIDSKYVVQYKTCWIEKNLGSAAKFFTIEESESNISDSINTLSKSVAINLNTNKKKDNCFVINEENEESGNDDKNKKSKKNKKSTKKINFKNYNKKNLNLDNCSNNSEEYKQKTKITKCYVNYRDDSRFLSKSIISSKYINENYENDNEYFFILMEYCDGLSLSEYISQNAGKSIDRKIIYHFMKQILKGLKKIHGNGIIHRDIKPQNIFIKNNLIKIGDFGLATSHFKNSKPLQTKDLAGLTPTYASPEQSYGKTYNEKIDIYASGITLFEMCGCFETFMERDESIKNLKNKRIICEHVNKNYPEESKIILWMTEKDYNNRPSAEEILTSDSFVKLGDKLGVKKA